MWASAIYSLRLSDKQFWRITPRQFDQLMMLHEQAQQNAEYLPALQVATTANFAMSRPDTPVDPLTIMPSMVAKMPKKRGPSKKVLAWLEEEKLRCTIAQRNAAVARERGYAG